MFRGSWERRGAGRGDARGSAEEGDRRRADPPVSEGRLSYRFVKRAFDIVFSAAVLVFFCWLFAVIAILIKIDDPKGRCSSSRSAWARTAKPSICTSSAACAWTPKKACRAQGAQREDRPVFKIAEDPRITRVGKWLRKLSLDRVAPVHQCTALGYEHRGPASCIAG